MRIDTSLIGEDFALATTRITNEDGNILYSINENHQLYIDNKRRYDKRTGYLCTRFTPAETDSILSDLSWYNEYMKLNYILLATYMADNPGKQLPVMNLLNIGYIPIGYGPSFVEDINQFIVQLLVLRKVPYALYRATVMGAAYYKTDTQDVWVSKMDAAKFLRCSPNDVTFISLLKGLLTNGRG